MLTLKNHDVSVPEDGEGRNFRFKHSETGHWSFALDWHTWKEKLFLHRIANGLPPITIKDAEDQLCASLPPGWCQQDGGESRQGVNTRFGWADLVAGMKAFAKVIFTGFVSQNEAERRARICGSCFFNVNPSGCGTCRKMASLITGDVARQRTPYDSDLKACAVCKCALKALVHFPISALETSPEKQAAYPSFCWQQQNSPNYLPNEEMAAA